MSIPAFAELVALEGIPYASKSRLNQAWSEKDTVPMRDDIAERISNLWHEIREMSDCFLPYRLDLSEATRVHSQLSLYRKAVMEGALQFLGVNINSNGNDTEPADNIQAQGGPNFDKGNAVNG